MEKDNVVTGMKRSRQMMLEESYWLEEEEEEDSSSSSSEEEDEDTNSTNSEVSMFTPQPKGSGLCLPCGLLNLMNEKEKRKFDLERCKEFLGSLDENIGNENLEHGVLTEQLCLYLSDLQERGLLKRWSMDGVRKCKGKGVQDTLRDVLLRTRYEQEEQKFLLIGLSIPTDDRERRICKLRKWYEAQEKQDGVVKEPLGWMAMKMDLPSNRFRSLHHLRQVAAEQRVIKEGRPPSKNPQLGVVPKKKVKTFTQLQHRGREGSQSWN
eukprot:scaffold14748_cov407-Ochromonas_danica.AAC.1